MTSNGKIADRAARIHAPDNQQHRLAAELSLARDEWGHLVLTTAGPTAIRPWSPQLRYSRFPIRKSGSRSAVTMASNWRVSKTPTRSRPTSATCCKKNSPAASSCPSSNDIVRVSGTDGALRVDRRHRPRPNEFVLKSEDDVRRIGESQIVIVDAHGTRYHIPDLNAVDAKSRRIVEWYV